MLSNVPSHLLKSRVIPIWGDIREKTTKPIVYTLKYLADQNNEPITIFIHSGGGCIEAAIAIIDEILFIQRNDIIVRTICQSKAYSAAAFILAMGSRGHRKATPNSSIMLHRASFELPSDYIDEQHKATQFTKTQVESLCRLIAKACRKKTENFMKEIDKSLWLSARQAKSFGVIDGIV
jgi:ATP-dependent Clp protease protease subunit